MKKISAILLCMALAFGLCACAQVEKLQKVELPPLPEVTTEPEETPVPTEAPAAEDVEEPAEEPASETPQDAAERVIVNYKRTLLENYDPAEGKQLILSFSYDTPVVLIEGRDSLAKIR